MGHSLRYFLFAIPGVVAGAIGFALGVSLAMANSGWTNAIYYSVVGLLGAPLATLAWATHSLRRRQIFAGNSALAGILGTMAILLELTEHHSEIWEASVRSPFLFVSWFTIWVLWFSLALVRLILFTPEHTRHHLSVQRDHRR